MARSDAYDLRFFESSENVRRVIADALGREPNAAVSKDVAVSIQQGRMFFESAADAPIEIRPLLLYYGMMAFAKSVVSGRGLRPLSALTQKHGLRDVSPHAARLAALTVKIEGNGTFHDFNDVICHQEGINYFENAMSRRHMLRMAPSAQLVGIQITLKDTLARIPGLQDLFQATFGEKADVLPFNLHAYAGPAESVDLRIDVPDLFEDRNSLRRIVEGIRAKYATLQRWRFSSAEKPWDNSVIIFQNVAPIAHELAPENLVEEFDGRRIKIRPIEPQTHIDFRQLLDPVAGRLTQPYPSLVVPIAGAHISDISLQYVGMFLLSSLVRYRPQTWVHSVSRFASQERPADDQALALIERFMNAAQGTFPNLVTRLLTQP